MSKITISTTLNPQKVRETLHSQSTSLKLSPLTILLNENNPFSKPAQHIPLHSAEKAPFREKSYPTKVLDTIPNFSFPFRLPFPSR